MSDDTPAKLTFYPTVREGFRPAGEFSVGGDDAPVAKLDVELSVAGYANDEAADAVAAGEDPPPEAVSHEQAEVSLEMLGPGAVTGVDDDQVVRTYPENDADGVPPNYFPAMELARPDLPWLFSPTSADDAGRNRPWCCLVAVERDADGVSLKRGRIEGGTGTVLTAPTGELPDPADAWAWAHVQLLGDREDLSANGAASASTDPERTILTSDSERAVARLVAARNLESNRTYLACLVPTYEAGRLAGLGEDPVPGSGTEGEEASEGVSGLAWSPDDAEARLPVYQHFSFSTGPDGDFEALARELDPIRLGPEVGVRSVDVGDPGPDALAAALGDDPTVDLGGALRSAMAPEPTIERPYGNTLAQLLDSPSDVAAATGMEAIGPPKYGEWHALARSLTEGSPPSWLVDLNVDPKYRLAAGFGASVIRRNQEALMAAAWEQFGDLRETNERLRRLRFADAVLNRSYRDLAGADLKELVELSGPIHDVTMLPEGTTVTGALRPTPMPDLVSSIAFRDVLRGGGPLGPLIQPGLDAGTVIETFAGGRSVGADESVFWNHGADGGIGNVIVDADAGVIRYGDETLPMGAIEVDEATNTIRVTDPSVRFEGFSATGGGVKVGGTVYRLSSGMSVGRETIAFDSEVLDLEEGRLLVGGGTAFDSAGGAAGREGSGGPVPDGGSGGPVPDGGEPDPPDDGGTDPGDGGDGTPQPGEGDPGIDELAEEADGPFVTVPADPETVEALTPDWLRDDTGDPMSVPQALTYYARETNLDQDHLAVAKAVSSLKSVEEYCLTAQRRVGNLESAVIEGEPLDELRALVEGPPPIEEVAAAVRGATLGTAYRRLSKVSADPRPDAVSRRLTPAELDEQVDRLGEAQDELLALTDSVAERIRSGSIGDRTELASELTAATREATTMLVAARTLLGYIDTGPPEGAFTRTLALSVETGDGGAATATLETQLYEALNPRLALADVIRETIPNLAVRLPDGLGVAPDDPGFLADVRPAPRFTRPMYKPLADLNQEYLMPGIGDVPKNSIGAVVTNPPFVEAYMVGLNHEMARELHWRGFPTDRRGSHFRHFWDRRGTPAEPTPDRPGSEWTPDEDPESRADVEELHRWRGSLGENGDPAVLPAGEEARKVVLLIRGELLRRYPNTVIYAAKAVASDRPDGPERRATGEDSDRVPALPRTPVTRQSAGPDLKFPVFTGQLDPDVNFLGFDLTVDQATNETDGGGDASTGWFFVLEEPPTEIRFGLDEPPGDAGEGGPAGSDTWNDLTFGHLPAGEGGSEGDYVNPTATLSGDWSAATDADWGENSAHQASITYQRPVRVAIHADDMLPSAATDGGSPP